MPLPKKRETGRYAARGVSATKADVHAAVDKLDRGLFPYAFCKVTPDHLTGDAKKCNVIHADGAGTKALLAYLHWRETGDARVFRGIAQDSLVMNLDDLLCVGATGRIVFSSTINRNARRFPAGPLAELIAGHEDFINQLRALGIEAVNGGGETADVGDLTPTLTVDSCAVVVMPRTEVVTNDKLRPGLVIVGLASFGQAIYENAPNSGIGSNGLTSARHDLLSAYYRKKFPETFDATTKIKYVYCGPYKMRDALPGGEGMTVGQALLSPTRTYAPVIAKLLRENRKAIAGLVHCSGGGQTKCLRFGRGLHFLKDNLFTPPPIFQAIQKASGADAHEMHRVFNMGHRMEVYCAPADAAWVVATAKSFGIAAQVVGQVGTSRRKDRSNEVTLQVDGKSLEYSLGG
ncbi:MAG TPA: AIR synthase-related protein [Opitutales bacterium]|jgi:phosphoribosylformylglycinamidine cyclo-ligase|nr:AIR synthase-related protein [Opitutales bacterium]